ncbi:urea ABC transporter ATP-binding subunit UrtE [Gibbsiella greigii]
MLSVERYSVSYGQSHVINEMNFHIGKNEIVALLGRNGMGKTTLMKSLIGMIPMRAGKITLANQNITALTSYRRARAGLGFVPQGRMIFPSLTVEDNILTGLSMNKVKRIPEDIYHYFPVLREMGGRLGGNLSGGQQQQLAIARALVNEPKLLLLDEPTEGIQPSIIKEMAKVLKKIRDDKGLTILVSEQVLSFALDIADRILVIEKGDIVCEMTGETIIKEKIAAYLSV